MGMYYDIVAANSRTGDDKKMWASVKQVDALLERMKEHHPDVYEGFINETINLFYDKHFDEMLGEMIVDKMYHCEREGSDKHKVQGEHYSIDYARKVRADYRDMPYNEWDWYVLLNMIYHDNICMLMEWWPGEENYNTKVIAMSINYITDDDATETKLWDRYIK
jgi:hypothetical protein